MSKRINTIPTYSFEDTSDENIKRFVDRKGDWTHYWLKREKRFVKAVNHILSLGYNKGPRFRQYLLGTTVEKAAEKLLSSGDEGTRTHRAISDLITGVRITTNTKYPSELNANRQEFLNDEEWDNLMAFERWCGLYQPRAVAIDKTVASYDKDGFAGTFDALLIITVPSGDKIFPKELWGKDVLILTDWKSSAGIWYEYESQVAAYWKGIVEKGDYKAFIDAYAGRIFTGIVRLGTRHKSGWEMEIWNQRETERENFYRFNAAQTIANRHEPTFEPDVQQLPTMFQIKVPLIKAKDLKVTKVSKKRK